jgi:predicted ester cyclase
VQSFKTGFPDSQYEINDIFGEGDKVAVDVTMRGTNTGVWTGRPPTGKPIAVGVIYLFTVKDDKVQSLKFESNQMLFMQQLGWMPAPEQA